MSKGNSYKTKDLKWEVDRACEEEGIPEPIRYLVAVMAGRDPRPIKGQVRQVLDRCIEEVQESEEGLPTKASWDLLVVALMTDPRLEGEYVPLADGRMAASEVLSYTHSKLKAVKVSGELQHLIEVKPLTAEEAEILENELFDEL